MNWKTERWLCIDTETTGLEPGKDRIVEVAATTYCQGHVVAGWHAIVDPEREIPEEVSKIHGITTEMAKREMCLGSIEDELLFRVNASPVLLAYNWPFDERFLAAELGDAWAGAIDGKLVVDPLVVVRLDGVGRYWKGKGRHRLSSVADRLGIPVHAETLHRAAADTVLTCQVLHKLLDHLPDDAEQCAELLGSQRVKQDENFNAWQAKQNKKAG